MGKLLRRTFLVGCAAAAGGLAVGYYLYQRPYDNPLTARSGEAVFNPYLKISADGDITVIVPRAEMGQGVVTTLAALVAEELDVDLADVKVEHGPASKAYFNRAMIEEGGPFATFDNSFIASVMRDVQGVVAKFLAMQATGGSSSTVDAFDKMRLAGATARVMLVNAAAARWGVDASSLQTARGEVVDKAGGRSLGFGELAAAAAGQAVPEEVELKPPSQWRLLGKSQPRVDMYDKVTGRAGFGIDVRLPGMVFATVRMNPKLGGPMVSMDASAAESMPGVIKVVNLDTGYAVVARNTWIAFQAADAVDVTWGDAPYPPTTDEIFSRIEDALASQEGFALRSEGDAAGEIARGGNVVEAVYSAPYLAHACMEPMNATAQWIDGRLKVWAPNQSPTGIVQQAGHEFDLDPDDIEVITTYLGGGFGRRFETDFSILAARVAQHTDGRAVQVTWTREEDISHDAYRPGAMCRAQAVCADDGPTAVQFRVASQSVMASALGRLAGAIVPPGPDKLIVDGCFDQPYALAHHEVSGVAVDLDIPVGFWRSVGHSFNPFFHECFMDEVALACGQDPLAMRLRLMRDHPAAVGVLEAVREMSGWGNVLSSNESDVSARGQGVAFCLSFGCWVAQVVQVADTDEGLRIEKVWCAADVGLALDPANLEAQMMSGIVFGLSSAMMQEITFDGGAVEQSNFHDYDAMRMKQCPHIEVRILENADKMGGAGEPGVPPSIPALANAIFAATGKRIRQLPLSKDIDFA